MKKDRNELNEINTTLDKMIQLENSKNKVNIYKIILLIAGCIAGLLIVIALCFIFYKSSFSLESLLSLLLAFFSIFISVFFYFKTEETSNHFYDMSYDFMKDVSVTLGKIEERFGEKLNNLNDKVSHLSYAKEEKTEELQTVEDEKQKMIDELLDKAKLNETQKEEYVKRLREKEEEADSLRRQLRHIDMKYRNIIEHRNELSLPVRFLQTIFDAFSPKELKLIRSVHFTDLPNSLKDKMIDLDIVMPDGELTPKGKILFENLDNIM